MGVGVGVRGRVWAEACVSACWSTNVGVGVGVGTHGHWR